MKPHHFLFLLLAILFVRPASAEIGLVVNSLHDDQLLVLENNGTCDLREAVAAIEIEATVGECQVFGTAPPHIITFATNGTIHLFSTLYLDADMTIDGGGDITLSGDSDNNGTPDYRVITITSGNVTLRGITVTKGVAGLDESCLGASNQTCGGGIYAFPSTTLTLEGATVSASNAQHGGGIYSEGALHITAGSIIEQNDAQFVGGGIYKRFTAFTITDSTIRNNTANVGAGILNQATTTIAYSTISGNQSRFDVGGILNENGLSLTISNSVFSGNHAPGSTGAIENEGTLTVSDSTFSSNSSGNGAGGIENAGTLTVRRSTFSGNSGGAGGAVRGHIGSLSRVINSTLSDNYSSSSGGAIYNHGTITVVSSTLNGNSAAQSEGGFYNHGFNGTNGSATVRATLIANNSGLDCSSTGNVIDIADSLVEDGTCITAGQNGNVSGDPAIEPLDDNGGATQTHALGATSVAIDAAVGGCVDPITLEALATDQRGIGRNQDGDGNGLAVCDMGAYEFPTQSAEVDVVENIELGDTVTFTNSVGVEMFVTGDTDLECVSAEQINANHPNADDTSAALTQASGTFWRFHAYQADCSTAANDFEITLTLPHAGYDAPELCRWTGADWDCAVDSADTSSATATGITGFSDWAVGYPPSADLVLVKSADVTSVARDDLFTYTLNVTNTSTLPATSVVLTDTLPSSVTPLTPSVALDGNLLRYHFDETSGNAIDTSGNGYDGTIIGASQGAAGQIGNSYSFDGSDDYVLAGGGVVPAFEMSNSLTMALWVYPTGPGGGNFGGGEFYGTIINREGEYQLYRHQDGDLWFTIANGNPGWAAINMGNLTPQDSWTHLVFTYDANAASDQIKLYVNGALTYTQAGSGAIGDFVTTTNLDELRIGGRQADTAAIFEGQIDEVYLYNRAISAVEAQSLYSSINGVGNCTGAFVCELGGLPAGSSATVTLPVQVNSDATGATIDNTATVTALGGDVRSADNSDTVSIPLFTPTTVGLSSTLTHSSPHWGWLLLTVLMIGATGVGVRRVRAKRA